ncbi:MAG: YHS domain-containing protein [Candidatus Zixiibacteriota bacterium]
MKRMNCFLICFAVVLFSLSPVLAGDSEKASDKPAEFKHQTLCPVMGGKIDSTAYTDIQGQRVYHCCPMCTAKIKADPDKYFEQAEKDGIVFENIQTTCPVSGETLKNKDTMIHYKGRTVYFCCPGCIPTFEKSPEKYLMVMDKAAHEEAAEDNHPHHNH